MLQQQLVPFVLSGVLLASPLSFAEEAHHPDQDASNTDTPAATLEGADIAGTTAPEGATMGPGPGGMGTMGRGMMQGDKGSGMGIMGRGTMHGGKRGGMGMMGQGMMHGGKKEGRGHGMHEKHRKLLGRLDLLEARMAKIEFMLERLLQR